MSNLFINRRCLYKGADDIDQLSVLGFEMRDLFGQLGEMPELCARTGRFGTGSFGARRFRRSLAIPGDEGRGKRWEPRRQCIGALGRRRGRVRLIRVERGAERRVPRTADGPGRGRKRGLVGRGCGGAGGGEGGDDGEGGLEGGGAEGGLHGVVVVDDLVVHVGVVAGQAGELQDGRGGGERADHHVGVLHAEPRRQHAAVRAAEAHHGQRRGGVGLVPRQQLRVIGQRLLAGQVSGMFDGLISKW